MTDIESFLRGHGIAFERHEHPAVFTTAESARLVPPLPGADTKNLFLRDKKGALFLVVVGHAKRVDVKALATALDTKDLSFAPADALKDVLGVDPGSVTVLGLANDAAGRVNVVIDEPVWNADAIQCHPLVNTATLVIPHAGLETFLTAVRHAARVLDVPAK